MRYVLLRDDDTSALTPVECLERLYRPFLARGLPVNIAAIPAVRTDAVTPDGRREGFLGAAKGDEPPVMPLAANPGLVGYLRANPGICVAQHGCHHDAFEFGTPDRADLVRRFDEGAERFREAGLPRPAAFVAPHDTLSRVAWLEAVRRFPVVSTGWFSWRQVPRRWWPAYVWKKLRRQPHWTIGGARLLSHPGCLLSSGRLPDTILPEIQRVIARQKVTVLVTHWWEYFRDGRPDEPFIAALHATAEHLATQPELAVVSFAELAPKTAPRTAPNAPLARTPRIA